ncbi:MAG: hypothetical protein WC325_09705 [Candidatus Bathyarchaeia archaeon]
MNFQKTQLETTAKQTSIMAMTAALWVLFIFLSHLFATPNFAILYLPIVLLGVFPFWFGWSGLAGCAIGAFIGGAFVMGLGFLGVIESVTALIIYGLIWLLAPKNAVEGRGKKNLFLLIGVYAVSFFAGTSYHFLQLAAIFPALFTVNWALTLIFPSLVLNVIIEVAICPVLLRTLSPKLRCWGFCSGTFSEWRSRSVKAQK